MMSNLELELVLKRTMMMKNGDFDIYYDEVFVIFLSTKFSPEWEILMFNLMVQIS